MTTNPPTTRRRVIVASLALAAVGALAGCGSSGTSAPTAQPAPAAATAPAAAAAATSPSGGAVLPVTTNPISNTATAQVLKIDSVLVENNVDPATGKTADDHLEIALSNTGTTPLSGFEVYYTFTDPTAGVSESYYTKLPTDFTIEPGASRIVHFDNTGAPDHFASNDFSLYRTSVNAQEVTVEVSATDAAPQTMTVQKDAGGAETAD